MYFIIFLIIIVGISRWRVVSVGDDYIFNSDEIEKVKKCQKVILLGAKVKFNGMMSLILKERAMAVEELYKNDKVCKIIISGHKEVGDDYIYDEVSPVAEYFIEQGIPSDIIISDYNGVDTFTSIRNLQEVFGVDDVIIVTQKFHLLRAVYIARARGIDANGFVAYKFPYSTKTGMYKDIVREWLAAVKAVWQAELMKN